MLDPFSTFSFIKLPILYTNVGQILMLEVGKFPPTVYGYHGYSLVLNRRRASCIRHSLDFPWSSCIAIMFLSKKVGLSCISPWFSTFPAYFIAEICHLLHLWGNVKFTNPPWSLSYEFSSSCISPRFSKNVQHVF